ncbi:sulfotransferase domain-containing protein [Sulfurimonas lithotrophica]|uniref:Sulfotransferase domain-containing protein n=1 Tax=Sulfurimonas lithotrophica TaxID=2590022 RepID=A0A5P8NY57_9BACT|nr:sulfotransferase domain-containing protein [Sulfurimonas lithotrophica]QFR48347.1 sulfotransferase domain-containing protein [Sulfurimonas lithotrophica]
MSSYKKNVIISSFVKSGTVLSDAIITRLTNLKKYNVIDNESLDKKVSNYIGEASSFSFGGLNNITFNSIDIATNFHDKNNSIYKHMLLDITDIIDLKNYTLYTGHMNPLGIIENRITNEIEKKIYVYRYGLDVLNSKMKFIENLPWVYDVMTTFDGNQKKFQALRYTSIDKIVDFINSWMEHIKGYLKYENEFYGLNYELLLSSPKKEIKRLANYLEVSISEEKIEELIQEVFYKELSSGTSRNMYYKHYNDEEKSNQWKEYLPYQFYSDFNMKFKQELNKLGLIDRTNIKPYKNNDFHKNFIRKYQLFKEREKYDIYNKGVNSFIETLVTFLENKKIIVFGSNAYTNIVLSKLKPSTEIVMVIKDDRCRTNYKILLENILYYDYILVGIKPEAFTETKDILRDILKEQGTIEVINCYDKHI